MVFVINVKNHSNYINYINIIKMAMSLIIKQRIYDYYALLVTIVNHSNPMIKDAIILIK